MIIRSLADLTGTDRIVRDPNGQWISHRLLLENDQMGFSFHVTEILPHCHSTMEYKNHLEACYCIEGKGEIVDQNGKSYLIQKGTIYALDKNDRHTLIAHEKMILISIFNPALVGKEVHLADGSYPTAKQS